MLNLSIYKIFLKEKNWGISININSTFETTYELINGILSNLTYKINGIEYLHKKYVYDKYSPMPYYEVVLIIKFHYKNIYHIKKG
jgi:hypothetical protein